MHARLRCHEERVDFSQLPPRASVAASFVEVYNDQALDLIDGRASRVTEGKNGRIRPSARLRIREDAVLGPFLEGDTVVSVADVTAVQRVVEVGLRNRHTCATDASPIASRSHAILKFTITRPGRGPVLLTFVDLAGTGQGDGLTGPRRDKARHRKACRPTSICWRISQTKWS